MGVSTTVSGSHRHHGRARRLEMDCFVRSLLICGVTMVGALEAGCDSKPVPTQSAPTSAAADTESLAAKAEAGDAAAMYDLATALDKGAQGQKKDAFQAFKWYLRSAEAGNSKAMGEVSKRYREGSGVREDFDASVQWADKGAERGDPDSLYLSTIRTPFDLFLGWEEGIESESEEAKFIHDVSSDLARLTRAAEGGSIDAKVRLGSMLREGVWYVLRGKRKAATPSDPDAAIKWLASAADSGSAIAALSLAQWYQVGGDGLKADKAMASKYWDRVEAASTPEELYAIGHRLQPGDKKYYRATVWRDRLLPYGQAAWKAREWLERAARQGHAQAALELGNMLTSERYGYSDESSAFAYRLQAADAALIEAQTAVAWAYYKGAGVPKDYSRAYTWSLRAATHPTATRQSMSGAQRFVAQLLAQGLGVDKDPVLAYAWANVSAVVGEKEAKELVASLDRVLDASQIREAQQISSAWKLGDDMKRLAGTVASSAAAASMPIGASDVQLAGSGTGFFVSATGTLVTNFHVAGKCQVVKVPTLTKTASVLATDAANDLAVLHVEGAPDAGARLADPTKVRQGQEIAAFGFPLDGYLPSAGNITIGLVSATSGPANNSSLIQISAAVQPGSSGGPVLDARGEVVGVVVGKADAIRIAKVTGDILQNVNFAVSVGTLQAFLDANRIEYRRSSYFTMSKRPDALADEARKFTVKVECWR